MSPQIYEPKITYRNLSILAKISPMNEEKPPLDPIELLDDVLKVLSQRGLSNVNLQSELEEAYFKYKNVFFDDRVRMREVLQKLIKDEYVQVQLYENDSIEGYRITFEGRYFLGQGGYREDALIRDQNKRAARIHTLILEVGALLAGVGGFVAAVYYGIEIWKTYP